MAICPNDGTTLTDLAKGGEGTYYVCTGCRQHYYGTGGILRRSPFTKGAKVNMTSGTTWVTHGLSITPADGEVMLTRVDNLSVSGSLVYITGYSSSNFKVDAGGCAATTSGVSFAWQYNKI
jgi:hypothetical protein